MAAREPIDVLLVSPGTTAGWRRADAELAAGFEQLGLSVATCTPDQFPEVLAATLEGRQLPAEVAAVAAVSAAALE